MKLIKTFMAAALLSTAIAGSVMAADALGLEAATELDDAKRHLGLAPNATLDTLTDLTINADLPERFAEAKTDYQEADVKALVANEAKLYTKLVEKAGGIEEFKAIVAKKKPSVKSFELKPEAEDLGLGEHLNGLLAQFVADPFAALVESDVAKAIERLHENDKVRTKYEQLLAARANDEVVDKDAAAEALKAFLAKTATERFEVDGKELDFDGYVKAETTAISVADHRAKLAEQAEAHKKALDAKKAAAHETAGGVLIENFIASASKFSSLKSNNAFKALNLESFTKANLKKLAPEALGQAILGSITELLESATKKDLQIAELTRKLDVSKPQQFVSNSNPRGGVQNQDHSQGGNMGERSTDPFNEKPKSGQKATTSLEDDLFSQ